MMGARQGHLRNLLHPVPEKPRYHYVFQRFTACCKWPGTVEVKDSEIAQIASFLGMAEHEFIQEFTRIRSNRMGLSLIDKHSSSKCIMLDGDQCRIQKVKPVRCCGFPNTWNFPGWEKECEAIAVPIKGQA